MKSVLSNKSDQDLLNEAKKFFIPYESQDRNAQFNEYHVSSVKQRDKVRSSIIYSIIEFLTNSVQELEQNGCFESDEKASNYLSEANILPTFIPVDLRIFCFNDLKEFLLIKLHDEHQVLNVAFDIMIKTKHDPDSRERLRCSSKKNNEVQQPYINLFNKINSTLDYFIENTATFANMNQDEMLSSIKESLPEISNGIIINCFNTMKNQIWNESCASGESGLINASSSEITPITDELVSNVLTGPSDSLSGAHLNDASDDFGKTSPEVHNESNTQYINEHSFFEPKPLFQLKNIMEKMLPLATGKRRKDPDATFSSYEDAIFKVYNYVFKNKETIKKFSLALNNKNEILTLFKEGGVTINVDGLNPESTLLKCVSFAGVEINLHANCSPAPNETRDSTLARAYWLDRYF